MLSDAEIQVLVDAVVFDGVKPTEMVVNVPLHIPKSVFGDQVNAFAVTRGWRPELEPSALKFLADRIRKQVRADFESFIRANIATAAKAQADATITQIFS